MSTSQSRKRLVQKLSKNLSVATPLVVAAFSMSQIATAQSSNCPAGSTYTLGICLVTTPSQAQPEAQTTGTIYQPTSYQATGEAEALKPRVKPKLDQLIKPLVKLKLRAEHLLAELGRKRASKPKALGHYLPKMV